MTLKDQQKYNRKWVKSRNLGQCGLVENTDHHKSLEMLIFLPNNICIDKSKVVAYKYS